MGWRNNSPRPRGMSVDQFKSLLPQSKRREILQASRDDLDVAEAIDLLNGLGRVDPQSQRAQDFLDLMVSKELLTEGERSKLSQGKKIEE